MSCEVVRCEVLSCLSGGKVSISAARYPDIQCKIKFLDVADDSDCGALQDVPLECGDCPQLDCQYH